MVTGSAQLKDWMARRGFTQRETAAYFGWDETFISKIVLGIRTPSLDSAIKIERATGIPVEAWSSVLDESAQPVSADATKHV